MKALKWNLTFYFSKRIYAIYHLKEYECVNLGPSSKYRRQEAGSVKELDEILDDLNKKKQ